MVVTVAALRRRDHFKRWRPIFFAMFAGLFAACRRPAARAHAALALALLAPLVPLPLPLPPPPPPPPPPSPLRVKHFI